MKKTKVALSVLALASFSLAAWDGSSKIPTPITRNDSVFYQITTPEELIGYLEEVVNYTVDARKKNAILKNDIVFGKDTATLSTKIWDFNTRTQSEYNSLFNGNNKTIYGLNATHSMFDYTVCNYDGIIKDLTIANSKIGSDTVSCVGGLACNIAANTENIEVRNTEVRAKIIAGGIAGQFGYCSHNGKNPAALYKNLRVLKGSVHAKQYAGGIAGEINLPLQDVQNTSDVYATDTTSTECTEELGVSNNAYAGGIVGWTAISEGIVGVTNAVNKGDVVVKQKCNYSYAGGIVGFAGNFIKDAQNEGNISLYSEYERSYAGGIAGYYTPWNNSLENSWGNRSEQLSNKGKIFLEGKDNAWAGGIFGYAKGATINQAMNSGDISAKTSENESEAFAGGIAGYIGFSVIGSSYYRVGNWGNVTATSPHSATAAGVVANLQDLADDVPGISQAFNYGNIKAELATKDFSGTDIKAAGIAGACSYCNITDVYNRGNIATTNTTEYYNHSAGLIAYSNSNTDKLQNAYNAASKIEGPKASALIAFADNAKNEVNLYNDKDLNTLPLYNEFLSTPESDEEIDMESWNTSKMKSSYMVKRLNVEKNTGFDRGIWTRKGGYPVFDFDTTGNKPNTQVTEWDGSSSEPKTIKDTTNTEIYLITTPEEFFWFVNNSKVSTKVGRLENDIIFGKDSLSVNSKRMKFSGDYSFSGVLLGNGHTVYGINSFTPLFETLYNDGMVLNLTIANSIFENQNNIAAIANKSFGNIVQTTIKNSIVKGKNDVGGLIGQGLGSGSLTQCSNINTYVYGESNAGGIAAVSTQTITSAYNSGNISGQKYVGGIAGSHNGANTPLQNCENHGQITAKGMWQVFAGGIVGYKFNGNVIRNTNDGKIIAASDRDSAFVGGIIGLADNDESSILNITIQDNGNWGSIDASSSNTIFAGGIIGYAKNNKTFSIVTKSFNYGKINVNQKDTAIANVGGIAGYLIDFTLTNSYNRGEISTSNSSGNIGSIIGLTEGSKDSIAVCYNAAKISKNASVLGKKASTGAIESLYYDKEITPVQGTAKAWEIGYTTDYMTSKDFVDELNGAQGIYWQKGFDYPIIMGIDTTKFIKSNYDKSVVYVIPDSLLTDSSSTYVPPVTDTTSKDTTSTKDTTVADTTSKDTTSTKDTTVADTTSKDTTSTKDTTTTGIKELRLSEIQMYTHGHNVTILNAMGTVAVFDLQGNLVTRVRAMPGATQFTLPTTGNYVVRAGSTTKLIAIK